jgi:hypothetical protein
MNIFYLDVDPIKAANLHCLRHTKMILESAQMLSTCVNKQIFNKDLYKSTHLHHPCTLWVQESKDNFIWLVNMSLALCENYANRHNGIRHKSEAIIRLAYSYLNQLSFKYSGLTTIKQVMPDKYKSDNPVKAYLMYYIYEKSKLFSIKDGNLLNILQEKLQILT